MSKVSVIIPTYNRKQLLTERALPSIINQTYGNLEILVIGDGTDEETVEAMADYPDTRVKFTNLPHFNYPDNQHARWGLQALAARNYGLDHATGLYVAMLDDDDEMLPDSIEFLLGMLKGQQADFCYGISETYKGDPPRKIGQRYGGWPPGDGAFCHGAFVYKASINYRYDLQCFEHSGKTGDADMWERMYKGGVKFYFTPRHVHNYYRAFP